MEIPGDTQSRNRGAHLYVGAVRKYLAQHSNPPELSDSTLEGGIYGHWILKWYSLDVKHWLRRNSTYGGGVMIIENYENFD